MNFYFIFGQLFRLNTTVHRFDDEKKLLARWKFRITAMNKQYASLFIVLFARFRCVGTARTRVHILPFPRRLLFSDCCNRTWQRGHAIFLASLRLVSWSFPRIYIHMHTHVQKWSMCNALINVGICLLAKSYSFSFLHAFFFSSTILNIRVNKENWSELANTVVHILFLQSSNDQELVERMKRITCAD